MFKTHTRLTYLAQASFCFALSHAILIPLGYIINILFFFMRHAVFAWFQKGKCSKHTRLTYLALAPFLLRKKLLNIFLLNNFESPELTQLFLLIFYS